MALHTMLQQALKTADSGPLSKLAERQIGLISARLADFSNPNVAIETQLWLHYGLAARTIKTEPSAALAHVKAGLERLSPALLMLPVVQNLLSQLTELVQIKPPLANAMVLAGTIVPQVIAAPQCEEIAVWIGLFRARYLREKGEFSTALTAIETLRKHRCDACKSRSRQQESLLFELGQLLRQPPHFEAALAAARAQFVDLSPAERAAQGIAVQIGALHQIWGETQGQDDAKAIEAFESCVLLVPADAHCRKRLEALKQ